MVRLLSLAFICSGLSMGALAQLKNQFTVENQAAYEKVELDMAAKTGNCSIRSSQKPDVLNIYSNLDPEDYRHTFSTEIKGSLCEIKLVLEQEDQAGMGKKLSEQVWGAGSAKEKNADKFWRVYLSNNKSFSLNFENGLGNTNIDLAGLSVSRLKVNTGSANVNIFYGIPVQNKIDMDTFFVKVDVGSLTARNMTLSRSKTIVADIGFGNAFLDFSEVSDISRNVIGSVGAGDLVILLPLAEIPVLVKINDSFLCNVNLGKTLKKIGENTFASASYTPDAKNTLMFDLDVSWGKIEFKEKNH